MEEEPSVVSDEQETLMNLLSHSELKASCTATAFWALIIDEVMNGVGTRITLQSTALGVILDPVHMALTRSL